MRALGDDTRFRIARVLAHHDGELCVCEIVDILRKPQYAVSRAARELARAGLLSERREGKLVYYRLAEGAFFARIADALREVPSAGTAADAGCLVHDLDRLRWRIDLRSSGKCVITYRPKGSVERGASRAANAEVGAKKGAVRRAALFQAASTDNEAAAESSPGVSAAKRSVLFVCVHNSARSQIAEEYLRRYGSDLFAVESAGLEPGKINPVVAASLREEGIEIGDKETRSVVDVYRQGRTFDYVITVCSRKAERNCPAFPGPVHRLAWPFPDPARFEGGAAEVAKKVAALKEEIREAVLQFIADARSAAAAPGTARADVALEVGGRNR